MHTDGVTGFSQWPLQHFFDYIFSFDSIVSNLQYPRECQGELWIIVRGDGLPCGGESWCQMSISFANHGHLARTLSYHWTVNVALCEGDEAKEDGSEREESEDDTEEESEEEGEEDEEEESEEEEESDGEEDEDMEDDED